MGSEANDGRIRQDGDKDLGLERLISSRHFEGLSQTGQTPGQGIEHLVEDHLSCAVILQQTKHSLKYTAHLRSM